MKFVIERSNEALFSHSGLALVGSLLKESGLAPLIDQIAPKKIRCRCLPFQRCRKFDGRPIIYG